VQRWKRSWVVPRWGDISKRQLWTATGNGPRNKRGIIARFFRISEQLRVRDVNAFFCENYMSSVFSILIILWAVWPSPNGLIHLFLVAQARARKPSTL
jgi:hypothetical protein